MSNSPYIRFLREIGYAYSAHPLSFFGELPNNEVYCPEIRYGRIVIKPETWNLSTIYINTLNYDDFCRDIKSFADSFYMPQYVFLCDRDNTVLLNTENDLCLQYLYKEIKIKRIVRVVASEYNNSSAWDPTDQWNDYMTEYVFSFMKTTPINITFPMKKHVASELDSERRFSYGESDWLYCKIYINPDYKDEYISQIGVLFKTLYERNLIDKGFFIQYSDEIDGYHLRVRLHTIQNTDLVKDSFLQWLNATSENYGYKKICFDTYEREVERYGGKDAINMAEQLFFADSILVSSIHRYKSSLAISDEVIGFYLSFSLLLSLFGNIELVCEELDKTILRKENKKEYIYYKKDFEMIVNHSTEVISNKDILDQIINRNAVALSFRDTVSDMDKDGRLANTQRDIFLSINHMFCNRIKADNLWERKILSFVRHFSYDMLQKQRHYNTGQPTKVKT